MTNTTAPKHIVDKNGKQTTVHARVGGTTAAPANSRLAGQGVGTVSASSKYHASLRFAEQLGDLSFTAEDGDNKAAGRALADGESVFGTIGTRRVCVQAYSPDALDVTDDDRHS